MQDTAERLSRFTVIGHWFIALAIIGMLTVGLLMDELPKAEKAQVMGLHKATGTVLLIFLVWRLLRRLRIGLPPAAADVQMPDWQAKVAKIMHWSLLTVVLLMPLSGMTMSLVGGHDISLYGLFTIPGLAEPNKAIAGAAHEVHEIVGFLLIGLIALHIAAGLKHAFVNRDGTLRRMLGGTVAGPVRGQR